MSAREKCYSKQVFQLWPMSRWTDSWRGSRTAPRRWEHALEFGYSLETHAEPRRISHKLSLGSSNREHRRRNTTWSGLKSWPPCPIGRAITAWTKLWLGSRRDSRDWGIRLPSSFAPSSWRFRVSVLPRPWPESKDSPSALPGKSFGSLEGARSCSSAKKESRLSALLRK